MTARILDGGEHRTLFSVRRWDADAIGYALRKMGLEPGSDIQPHNFDRMRIRPYSETVHEGNLVMNTVWTAFFSVYFGTTATKTKFSSTVGRIGVGDGTPTVDYLDSDLGAAAGSSHRLFKFCAAAPTQTVTDPTRSLAWTATFQAADAMFAWNEFGIDQGTADGTTVVADFMNHASGIAQGTKGTNQVWSATATLSFT